MRTNVIIDDELMEQTMRLTGTKTKREAIELGLRTLIRLGEQQKIRQKRGRYSWGWRPGKHAPRQMILVDSSVWIDYFRGTKTAESDALDHFLINQPVIIGDLILTEVLQGFTQDKDFKAAHKLLTSLHIIELGGREIAIKAAHHRSQDHRHNHRHAMYSG